MWCPPGRRHGHWSVVGSPGNGHWGSSTQVLLQSADAGEGVTMNSVLLWWTNHTSVVSLPLATNGTPGIGQPIPCESSAVKVLMHMQGKVSPWTVYSPSDEVTLYISLQSFNDSLEDVAFLTTVIQDKVCYVLGYGLVIKVWQTIFGMANYRLQWTCSKNQTLCPSLLHQNITMSIKEEYMVKCNDVHVEYQRIGEPTWSL